MKLAVHLAKEVAAILRAVLTHETKKLYNDSTVHLLCSNYWAQPIYQELLHSSSRRNATRECERKRPSSGLARVTAYAKPPKQRSPSASGTSFSDWIGGTCHADTLQVWFPAHWAPVVLQQLQKKEDRYVQRTRLAWTRKWLQRTFPSNGRKLGLPRRTEPWGPFSIHFTALKMNPFKRTTSFVPAHAPAAPGPA